MIRYIKVRRVGPGTVPEPQLPPKKPPMRETPISHSCQLDGLHHRECLSPVCQCVCHTLHPKGPVSQ